VLNPSLINGVMKSNDEYDKLLTKIAHRVKKLSESEIEIFFRAFLTPSEILEFCDRYLIIEALLNKKTQRAISKDLGLSISKITAGSRELKFGPGKEIFAKLFNL
jgi:Trp operon repressor